MKFKLYENTYLISGTVVTAPKTFKFGDDKKWTSQSFSVCIDNDKNIEDPAIKYAALRSTFGVVSQTQALKVRDSIFAVCKKTNYTTKDGEAREQFEIEFIAKANNEKIDARSNDVALNNVIDTSDLPF